MRMICSWHWARRRQRRGLAVSASQSIGFAWPQLINDAEGSRSVSAIYAVRGYPTKILLNPEGVIAKICVGEDPDFYSDFVQLFK